MPHKWSNSSKPKRKSVKRKASSGTMKRTMARGAYTNVAKKVMVKRRAPMVETFKREAQDLAQVNAWRFTSPGSTLTASPFYINLVVPKALDYKSAFEYIDPHPKP